MQTKVILCLNEHTLLFVNSRVKWSFSHHRFEKMSSGMYLGELVRLCMIDLIEKGLLFDGQMPDRLRTKNSFHTKYLTEVERQARFIGLYICYFNLTLKLSDIFILEILTTYSTVQCTCYLKIFWFHAFPNRIAESSVMFAKSSPPELLIWLELV